MVPGAHRRRPERPPEADRGAGPQAADCALALRRPGLGTRRRRPPSRGVIIRAPTPRSRGLGRDSNRGAAFAVRAVQPASLPGGLRLSDYLSVGVIARVFPCTAVREALRQTEREGIRRRALPADVMMYLRDRAGAVPAGVDARGPALSDGGVALGVAGSSGAGVGQVVDLAGAQPAGPRPFAALRAACVRPLASPSTAGAEDVEPDAGELVARFEGRDLAYGFGELDALVPAYAVTVHKSQGSEYPAVVIPVLTQHYAMLRRNLLYTAVTRGKRLVVLVGQKKAVAIAVRNASGLRRWSKLDEWLAGGQAHRPGARFRQARSPAGAMRSC